MAFSDNITMIGLSVIIIGTEVYGYYICFYILMLLFVLTLPKPINFLENISA